MGTLPLSYVIDRLAGVIKTPFLIWEAQRMQALMQKKNSGHGEIVGF